ncbi:ATP-binding protein [Herbivorax sp. ANBcel31]|uniref:ATP-binding protein n=1 Tax=Herbivorax sp. ANBcel31 TaxID=3069754 RepID=UPI0027AF5CF0|nr:ATP-binding protein [Herbivorax sp. ANBcel31]MDQ2087253.1 ATP-binding protein [Herbivorax sp. ANBcel31]
MIKRELYMTKIRPFMNQNIVKVLTGIRRSGKSVMLELIREELSLQGVSDRNFLSVNLESKNNEFISSVDGVYAYVRNFAFSVTGKVYLFFDEIQELDGWETMINSCMIDFDADIYITGSNAKLLSGELATYLAGRYVEFKIFPFSYKEILDISPDKNKRDAFQIYLTRGGMPFLYQFPIDTKSAMQYLSDIYDSIILKDIATRNKIRDIELLKRLIQFFVANIGNAFSATNISKYLKSEMRGVSTETIYNYIDYCKTACFLHLVQREDVIGKKLLQFQEKIYIADHGIREAIYGNNMRDINQTLENIVYMELLRRGYDVRVGKNNKNEIDFVSVLGNEKIYVQVTYILASEETVEREFTVLESIPDNYPKYVVSMDEIDRGRNGIKNVNIRDFLLMDKY